MSKRRSIHSGRTRRLGIESLETRLALSTVPLITPTDVQQLLQRAAAASSTNQAIIAVVDRTGAILGVREESGVLATFNGNTAGNVFAIDGAVAEARTAAFFSNDAAPLTSRTVRFISQSTITQREVESSPDTNDPDSTVAGPGLVAPIGIGGHFPPGISPTDSADLFGIELSNRDNSPPGVERFNINPTYVPGSRPVGPVSLAYVLAMAASGATTSQAIYSPASYGVVSGILPTAQPRGIGTLPGGIPLYKNGSLVGGIGVFFPGPDGYASYEQGFVPGVNQTDFQRTNAPLESLAEWMAFAAAGGSTGGNAAVGALGPSADRVAPVSGYNLPFGSISLGGITLDIYGPHGPYMGIKSVLQVGASAGVGNPNDGANQPVNTTPGNYPDNGLPKNTYGTGQVMPTGWLVTPHDGTSMTAAQVTQIINQGIAEASLTRAQIRLPIGSTTEMTFAVVDKNGNILGLYRMPDATVFSIDIAVAKARNDAYYDQATVQPEDLPAGIAAGTAFNSRTFRYLALPNFPTGAANSPPGPFSALNDPGINPLTAEDVGPPLPASVYESNATSVMGYVAFVPQANFRDPNDKSNQNGVVFFPGSVPLYKGSAMIGGFGVSGDGVDQDDFVTYYGSVGYAVPSTVPRADQTFFHSVRLPYFVFPRNPTDL